MTTQRLTAVDLDEALGAVEHAGLTYPPTAYGDQVRAAARDQMAAAEQTAGHLDASLTALSRSEVPEWQRLVLLDALRQHLDGSADTCMHAPSATRPEPVYAAAYRPGLIVCRRCTHLLSLPAGSVADRTCDGCGAVTDNGQMHARQLMVGALALLFGTCAGCTPAEADR